LTNPKHFQTGFELAASLRHTVALRIAQNSTIMGKGPEWEPVVVVVIQLYMG
jgi:hypothetical protein